ncbi:hypothetical protein QWY85_16920 [Neolewinella lacunae]|uniref:Uncharacterized protein n=1 Tax=Neolewinella lacunae TaxID=1517758 RepID=A0A923PFY3_9BACT|nr:hypothetical protein [Neolewinella lacunae]MBC6993360.1 hypothetical protein [Neolewinella lacunae]MDN3636350.1 hypothetical protein [Neolewinella lacunae]
MKLRNLIPIIAALLFASCKEITKEDLKGDWIAVPNGCDEPLFDGINFKENGVELFGSDSFKETGGFQIRNGVIKIPLDRDDLTFETEIQHWEEDTLVIFDSLIYHRNREITHFDFEEYELIGIGTEAYLSKANDFNYVMHYYRTADNLIKVRLGDKATTLDEIPLFLANGNGNRRIVVYIGKGITLNDLKNLYYRLASVQQLRITLGTKRDGFSSTHIFADIIEIWWDDLVSHLEKLPTPQPPPPPPTDFTSKESYLTEMGEEVEIFAKDDFRKIEDIATGKKYVVSISSNLSVENYIGLKKLVVRKRKLNNQIITEIK